MSVQIMGILNVTPDSFSDGISRCGSLPGLNVVDPEWMVLRARRLIAEGADILDIGGESTRPGAKPVDAAEEIRRIEPVVQKLSELFQMVPSLKRTISVDTYRPEVVEVAIRSGATMINDVNAALTPGMPDVLQTYPHVEICLMHGYAEHQKNVNGNDAENIVAQVYGFLQRRRDSLVDAGIERGRIWLDPGIGFGKTPDQNILLIQQIRQFRELGCRLLVGVSRKRFLTRFTQNHNGTCVRTGASIGIAVALAPWVEAIRVHDVEMTVQAVRAAAACVD
ncbi:MAG: dihydropteroate synthase [Thermoguttaceae bacterium]|nr:dihydropteroate synthase [Thermoguttaceae bacterium]